MRLGMLERQHWRALSRGNYRWPFHPFSAAATDYLWLNTTFLMPQARCASRDRVASPNQKIWTIVVPYCGHEAIIGGCFCLRYVSMTRLKGNRMSGVCS